MTINKNNQTIFMHKDFDTAGIRSMYQSIGKDSNEKPEKNEVNRIPLYEIRYLDKEVEETLEALKNAIDPIHDITKNQSDDLKNKVDEFIASLLLEIIYLYKDPQYESEKVNRPGYQGG